MSGIKPPSNNSLNGASSSSATQKYSGKPQKASILPLLIALILILLSSFLSITKYDKSASLKIFLIGYFCTPLAVGLCLGWDSLNQRKKTKNDPWFIPKPKYSLLLRVLTGLSFIFAFPHIHSIARILSEYLAEMLGQA